MPKHRRKVLMLTLFPSAGNGSSTVVRDLAVAMSSELDVHVFYVDLKPSTVQGYTPHFHVVDDFPVLRTHPKSPAQRKFIELTPAEINAYVDELTDAVRGVVASVKPDLLHVHHGWLGATVAARICDEANTPFVVQFHGTEIEIRPDYRSTNTSTFAHLEEKVLGGLKQATALVTISPTESAKTREFAQASDLRVPVSMIPNGYDESVFHPQPPNIDEINRKFASRLGDRTIDKERPIVLFVGRFASFKGIEHLVRAAPLYAETGAQTILCGDGELRPQMEALSKELGLSDVFFLGLVDHFDDLPALYCAADVLIVPSEGEPFGLVAIEALGAGTPFIGSDSGALPYILSSGGKRTSHGAFDTTGWGAIVPFGDSAAIANAASYCISVGFKERHGMRISREVKEVFSIEKQRARFLELYDSVIANT